MVKYIVLADLPDIEMLHACMYPPQFLLSRIQTFLNASGFPDRHPHYSG